MEPETEPVWRPWATIGLIAVVALVWVAMTIRGGSWDATQEQTDLLVAWGAAARPDLFLNHEYWRLFTANFLHIGIIHLALNGYSLWVAGQAIEMLYGRARLLYLFVTAGVIGAAASAVLGPPMVLSAGASGAIFGLVGALVWYRLSSPMGWRIRWKPLVMTLVLNLGLGLSLHKFVDNWDHLGGVVGGFVAAAVVGVPVLAGWQLPRFHLGKVAHRVAAAALLALVAAIAAGLVPLPGAGHDLARAAEALNAGRFAEAEAGLRRAVQRQPDEPTIRYNLTQVLLKQGKCTEAKAEYRQLIALGVDDPDVSQLGQAVATCPR
jgi:rhomboid protease GluP